MKQSIQPEILQKVTELSREINRSSRKRFPPIILELDMGPDSRWSSGAWKKRKKKEEEEKRTAGVEKVSFQKKILYL